MTKYEYSVDPLAWITQSEGPPIHRYFHQVIWDKTLTEKFLEVMGEQGWQLVTTHPYTIFVRLKEEECTIQ